MLGRFTVPNIESRCNQLKLGHPPSVSTGNRVAGMVSALTRLRGHFGVLVNVS